MNLSITPEFMARVRWHEPMSNHTSWRAGGPADMYFIPRDIEDLSAFLRALPVTVPVYWVGLGSEPAWCVMVASAAWWSATAMARSCVSSVAHRRRIYCQASVPCTRIARAVR
jgi:UDP-N-acetylmuramate dehydrogenase